jgi:hypothetical protein
MLVLKVRVLGAPSLFRYFVLTFFKSMVASHLGIPKITFVFHLMAWVRKPVSLSFARVESILYSEVLLFFIMQFSTLELVILPVQVLRCERVF